MTDPMTTERLAEISERLTTPRLGRSMARETDLDLLAIRALLAEVRRLQDAAQAIAVKAWDEGYAEGGRGRMWDSTNPYCRAEP